MVNCFEFQVLPACKAGFRFNADSPASYPVACQMHTCAQAPLWTPGSYTFSAAHIRLYQQLILPNWVRTVCSCPKRAAHMCMFSASWAVETSSLEMGVQVQAEQRIYLLAGMPQLTSHGGHDSSPQFCVAYRKHAHVSFRHAVQKMFHAHHAATVRHAIFIQTPVPGINSSVRTWSSAPQKPRAAAAKLSAGRRCPKTWQCLRTRAWPYQVTQRGILLQIARKDNVRGNSSSMQ